MSDTREWFKVDVGYLSNPKISPLIDEAPRAVLLHIAAIAYARQHRTSGRAPVRIIMAVAAADDTDLAAAIEAGLLTPCDAKGNATRIATGTADSTAIGNAVSGKSHAGSHAGSHVLVHDYLDHQEDPEKIAKRSHDARNAALTRWNTEKPDATGSAEGDAKGNATRIATGNAEKRREEVNYPLTPLTGGNRRRRSTPTLSDADASDPERDAKGPQPTTYPAAFEDWWARYPSKVGKAAAVKAWRKAKGKTTPETLLTATDRYAQSERVARGIICNPATWLNQERWLDPIAAATGTESSYRYASAEDY